MPGTVVVGVQWGDEGKGKVIDFLAERADVVVRFQGGPNAGHTVQVGSDVFKFRLLPSGMLRAETLNVIGNGVVVDPTVLEKEIAGIRARGFPATNLRISERAHVIMPYHRTLDGLEERMKGGLAAGTTLRGIGPCYEDKAGRFGIRIIDLIDEVVLREKLEAIVPIKQRVIEAFGGTERLSVDALFDEYREHGARMREYVVDTSSLLDAELASGREVLFEGAQGTHLCIDHGIYPYGTSSDCVAGFAAVGAGVGPARIDRVVGVTKAYTTRVGAGPFPSELPGEIGERIRQRGQEFGTVTSRPRRTGWLDLVMLRYSKRVNGLTGLAVTKLDTLGGLPKVNVCEAYEARGEKVEEFPASMRLLAACQPVYREFDGWPDLGPGEWRRIAEHGYDALPVEARDYLAHVAEAVGVPVQIVGIGKGREDTLEA